MDGLRLGHVVHSYIDKVTLTFTADRDAVPDPDFYAQCIQKSFDEHMQALKKLPVTENKKTSLSKKKKDSAKKQTTKRKAGRKKSIKKKASV
jgi:hypothetical protein